MVRRRRQRASQQPHNKELRVLLDANLGGVVGVVFVL